MKTYRITDVYSLAALGIEFTVPDGASPEEVESKAIEYASGYISCEYEEVEKKPRYKSQEKQES